MLGSLLSTTLGCFSEARAQFPRIESFKNNSATGFTVGGSASLTGGAGDPNGQGYLQLTSVVLNQSGFAVDQTAFAAPQGFGISFEFFAYGGTGADGFSCFLFDGSTVTFAPGASGGSLGYAQKTVDPISNGVPNGYIGIGIDEFGNYANPTEGRIGGPGSTPDAVSIRGAGNGRSATDYPYLDGSGTLPFSLDVPTARAQVGSGDYRRAYIDLVPTNGTYQVTVRIQHGNQVTTAIRSVPVPTPPPTLRIGFSGSTGGSTNVHEIRNLAIVRAPFANDDLAGTPFNQAVRLNVLANDVAPGSNFDPATVDLDISATGVQQTLLIPGQGTFSVTAQGEVVFTPSGTFSGVVTVPYTVRNVLGDQSSPANITIIVQGADVATTVSGPSTANPGARITYTLNTTNLGTEPATSVVPTILLAPNLPAGSVTLPAGATYTAGTGLVTFATIPSIAAGASPFTNSVTFTVPETGTTTITGTGNSTAATPDPVSTNNTSAITTQVTGLANIDKVCSEPGKDGPGALTASSVPNTYFQIASGTVVNAGNTSIPLAAAASGSTPISAGDIVLIMQMQGADINTTNTTAYGTSTGNYTAGQYEYGIALNSVPTTGGTLTLVKGVTNGYVNQDFGGTLTGQRRFQVIRVPQYSSLNVSGAVTGAAWNGRAGGVLALDVAGKTTFATSASLNMDAKGFRGGAGRNLAGSTSYNSAIFVAPATNAAHAAKGEGYAGTPQYTYSGTALQNNLVEGYFGGSQGQGAPGNGGGGATDYTPGTNSGNAGGGGGSNGGAGGTGGFGFGSGGTGEIADGGRAASGTSASRLLLGGGGGAGSSNDATALRASGGTGGGIIVLRTGAIAGTATLSANGGNAPATPSDDQGGGGGGAGGAIVVLATPPSGVANGLSGLTISAIGGTGGSANTDQNQTTQRTGPGGGGGGGLIFSNGAFANSGATGNTSPVRPGANGVTDGNSAAAFGATAGTTGIITPSVDPATTPIVAGAGACEPVLNAALSTSTPNITRTGGAGSAVNPATYLLAVSNTGGAATNVTATASLAANIVGYDASFSPTVTLTLANGTTSTLGSGSYTLPTADGTSTPAFGGLSIPAGATTTIAFRARLAATAQDNFAYQASVLLQYLDPTRLTTPKTVQPGLTYDSYTGAGAGVAAAPGNGYSGSFSTSEDVTIARPLPVELKAFEAKAVQLDALLTWTTASEVNNDRFEIERSFDARSFEQVGTVRGQGTTSRSTDYGFTDAGAGRRGSQLAYYRLRQVDTDGKESLSPVRVVRFSGLDKTAVSLYPNPAPGRTTLDLTGLPAGTYQIQVLDLAGRAVQNYTLEGANKHPLNLLSLPQGSYVVRVVGQGVSLALPLTHHN
ncbi:Ig-like domain-containing protein [Hymenobacter canadensis]|uniref:T9SS type A sorting domain-containing protein n=1 Tax=Hymenobacter canadensis TaxID=2999067 RepID=A0ABY7LQF3_9BACT|nr:T9SS type A sorting domain-containing protein [Hymenobacter canadensis]WBA42650.1 T9SS type A sorting domain-containing protein [Hymenobacter canadensis]